MNYFTLSDFFNNKCFNFVKTDNHLDYIHNKSGLSSKAKLVYDFLYFKLKQSVGMKKPKTGSISKSIWGSQRFCEEGNFLYVTVDRKSISKYVGICIDTVTKYIKELVRFGLIDDVRSGINITNKIFLKFPDNAKRYDSNKSENTDIEKVQKKEDDVPPSTSEPEKTGLIKQCKDIISQLTIDIPDTKYVKQVMSLCSWDLNDLRLAVEYNLGNPNIRDPFRILAKTLRDKYYKEEKKSNVSNPCKTNKSKKTPKNSRFTNISEHGYDWNKIGELEQELIDSEVNKFE